MEFFKSKPLEEFGQIGSFKYIPFEFKTNVYILLCLISKANPYYK